MVRGVWLLAGRAARRPAVPPILVTLAALMAALTAGLTVAAAPSRAQDLPPPPGVLVPLADTRLHLDCTGAGGPAVVLEAGLGGNFLDWTRVQPLLARHHRVCSYDRAGAGYSARSPRPRTADAIGDELRALVEAAGIPRPFILVGHSFGGLVAATYARRHPDDVAGLVLLDAMHPDQFDRFAAAGVDLPTDPALVLGRTAGFAATYGLPPELHRLAMDLALADSARVFMIREMSLMRDSAATLHTLGLPRLPARVLVHGNHEWQDVPPAGQMEIVWQALQQDYAARLGAPPPALVAGSGHQIALDAPDAVADAVDSLSSELSPPVR